ncbi:P-loop containing nucleoside triphosphate hydrolase protein [Lichtheimia hyalospora FSU 10163]|nr:P-loop containing nucleoside triphosphate hydrolase protein [Lichtheimia hyalospora FSU 10163]
MHEKLKSTDAASNSQSKNKKEGGVPIYKLFRFATKLELALLFVASILMIGVGALMPASMIIFGDMLGSLGHAAGSATEVSSGVDLLSVSRPMILVFVYMATADLVASYLAHAIFVYTGERQTSRIKRLFVHNIMRQEMAWFDIAEEGSLTTRLATDAQMLQEGISEKFGNILQMISQVITGIIVAFINGPILAAVVLATIPLIAAAGSLMGYYYGKFTQTTQDTYAGAGKVAEEMIGGIKTIFAFSLQDRFQARYEERLKEARKTGCRRGLILAVLFAAFMFVLFSSYGLSFWYGAKLVRDGRMTGAKVIIVFYAMLVGTMAFMNLPLNLSAVSAATAAAKRIFSTIDRIPSIDIDDPGKRQHTLGGQIEFRDISFSYPTRPNIPILKSFSTLVSPGTTLALVGASGSGKSTIAQLLQRFYDPIGGEILLDGVPLKDLGVQSLRKQIGVVSQEPVLFNTTIRKNLLLGALDDKVSDEMLVRACKTANCHDFISALPDGYDTDVGQSGGMLSGGQRQRIAIARAILKDPAILLLDEATSALDTQSERLVQKALDAASENRTTLIIAHRLSTIKNADNIIVLHHGDIVEQGTHDQLLAKKGAYAELVRKQEIATDQQDAAVEQDSQDADTVVIEDEQEPRDHMNITLQDDKNDYIIERKKSIASSVDGGVPDQDKQQREREAKYKNVKAPFFKVFMQMRPEWSLILVGLVGCIMTGALFPCLALVLGKVFAVLVDPEAIQHPPGPMDGANLYAFLFVICAIGGFIGFVLQIGGFEMAGERYTERLRAKMFAAFMRQEAGFFDEERNSMGALTSMLAADAKNVNDMITKVMGEIGNVIFTAITGFVIAFVHGWALTLVIVGTMPFMVAASGYETKIELDYAGNSQKAGVKAGEVVAEAIKTIRTVAALTKQQHFEQRYKKANAYPKKLAYRKAYLGSLGYALNQAMVIYVYAIAFYAGVRFIEKGMMSIEQMMVVMLSVIFTAMGIGRGSMFISLIVKAKYAALSAFELLERKPAIDGDLEGIEPSTVRGEISFENVAFAYPRRPDIPIFHGDFNMHASSGKTIALVGHSGCGKSTVIGLLERWYDVSSGAAKLDDTITQNYTLDNLRSHISLVGQEPILFDLSIGENIRYGVLKDEKTSQEQVEQACIAANIHKFIMDLPDGYNTRVGDRGSQLSGGQKQRIAIARALIRNPRVLLLDEATSALDSESEKHVQEAIDNVLQEGGRTVFTIAHRLSTIQNSDQICYFKNGRVTEQGTHWELLKLDGDYKKLVEQQTLQ